MSVESHMSDANCNDNAKSKFDCDQCGLTLPTTAGLKVKNTAVFDGLRG